MKKKSHEKIILGMFLVSLIIIAAAPHSTVIGQEPKWGGTLVAANYSEPKTLNTALLYDMVAQRGGAVLVYDKLVEMSSMYEIIPELAETWDVSPDTKEYTFHLVRNATWHDGHKFTAADVKFTYETILENQGSQWKKIEDISSIEILDDYTVKIILNKANAAFLSLISDMYSAGFIILPKHLYEGTDWTTNPYNEKPVGTGPFKFVEWVKGSHITVEANENYWKGRPYLDKIIYKTIASTPTAIAALEANEVSFLTHDIPPFEYNRLSEKSDIRAELFPAPIIYHLAMNMKIEPYNNKDVRWAMAHAIDKTDLINKVLLGTVPESKYMYLESVDWAVNKDAMLPSFDLAKAEQLLDDAGYPRGADGIRFKTKLATFLYGTAVEEADVLKEQLGHVGIEVETVVYEWGTYVSVVIENRDFDIAIMGGFQGPDPSEWNIYWKTDGYRNIYGFSDPRVDELLDQGSATADPIKRQQAYHEIQEILLEAMPRVNYYEVSYRTVSSMEYSNFFFEEQAKPTSGFFDLGAVWWEQGSTVPEFTIQAALFILPITVTLLTAFVVVNKKRK